MAYGQGVHGCAARDSNPNPRIKSLSVASSRGFVRVRAAAQIACTYSRELHRTGVNCNPNCNPGGDVPRVATCGLSARMQSVWSQSGPKLRYGELEVSPRGVVARDRCRQLPRELRCPPGAELSISSLSGCLPATGAWAAQRSFRCLVSACACRCPSVDSGTEGHTRESCAA
jgi:hypothetical protein